MLSKRKRFQLKVQGSRVQRMAAESTYFSVYQFSFKMCFVLSFLGCCGESAAGMVTLSPMMVALVCHVGDPLLITCTASFEFIKWSIVVVNDQGMEEEITVSRNSRDSSPPPRERIINSTKFTFSRTSAEDVLPLISTLAINSTSIGLNGTVVHCINTINPVVSTSTSIHIVDTSNNLYTPTLEIISKELGADNITVTVEWAQQVGAVYTASISPLTPLMFPGSTSHQLTIQYNTEYNLSVVAITPCGNATAFIGLNYVKCGHPNLLPVNNDSVPIIEGHDNISVLEGSIVRFSCSPGLELTGSNSAKCTVNGEWEPDPSGLMCTCENLFNNIIGSSLYILDYSEPAVVGTTVSFNCSQPGKVLVGSNTVTCMKNGQWVPNPSQLQMSCRASCGIPETHSSVNYSSYNSTLEGSTVTFRCTDMPFQDHEVFTTMCLKNASWIPEPVRLCTSAALKSDDGDNRIAVIAGGSFGVLAVFLVIFLIVVGVTICIKKDSFLNHRKPLVLSNIELEEEHAYNVLVHNCNQPNKETAGNLVYADLGSQSNNRSRRCPENVHDQSQNNETAENIVYADVGPLSNNQSRSAGRSFDFQLDEHKVEYAQLNHKAKVSVPISAAEKSINEDIALSLDSLLIQLQDKVTHDWYQFGVALGIKKEVLDRCLKYPPEQSIIEILDHWLRSHVEQTWMEIARALRQINYHQLAEDIESIAKTGKLLIEVNVDDIPGDVLHRSQFDLDDDEPPPPIPPKRFEEDPEESQYEDVIKSSAAPIRPPRPPKP